MIISKWFCGWLKYLKWHRNGAGIAMVFGWSLGQKNKFWIFQRFYKLDQISSIRHIVNILYCFWLRKMSANLKFTSKRLDLTLISLSYVSRIMKTGGTSSSRCFIMDKGMVSIKWYLHKSDMISGCKLRVKVKRMFE